MIIRALSHHPIHMNLVGLNMTLAGDGAIMVHGAVGKTRMYQAPIIEMFKHNISILHIILSIIILDGDQNLVEHAMLVLIKEIGAVNTAAIIKNMVGAVNCLGRKTRDLIFGGTVRVVYLMVVGLMKHPDRCRIQLVILNTVIVTGAR